MDKAEKVNNQRGSVDRAGMLSEDIMISIAEFVDDCVCDIDLQCLLGEAQAQQSTGQFINQERIQAKYKSLREVIQIKHANKPVGVQL